MMKSFNRFWSGAFCTVNGFRPFFVQLIMQWMFSFLPGCFSLIAVCSDTCHPRYCISYTWMGKVDRLRNRALFWALGIVRAG